MPDLWARLKERKLAQWVAAHVAVAFALLQGVDIFAQRFAWPDAIERVLLIALCVGFFVVILLAWYHGERGVQKVTGTELLLLALLLAIGALHRYAEAERQARTASKLIGGHPDAMASLARGIADPAVRGVAVRSLETSPELADLRRDAIVHALFLVALRQHERAISLLKGYAINGDSTTTQLLWYPMFDPIRNDPRFKAVLKKLGLPYTQIKGATA